MGKILIKTKKEFNTLRSQINTIFLRGQEAGVPSFFISLLFKDMEMVYKMTKAPHEVTIRLAQTFFASEGRSLPYAEAHKLVHDMIEIDEKAVVPFLSSRLNSWNDRKGDRILIKELKYKPIPAFSGRGEPDYTSLDGKWFKLTPEQAVPIKSSGDNLKLLKKKHHTEAQSQDLCYSVCAEIFRLKGLPYPVHPRNMLDPLNVMRGSYVEPDAYLVSLTNSMECVKEMRTLLNKIWGSRTGPQDYLSNISDEEKSYCLLMMSANDYDVRAFAKAVVADLQLKQD